jgi:hypothetical protein
VAQGEGPEFKPQYCKNKTNKKKSSKRNYRKYTNTETEKYAFE